MVKDINTKELLEVLKIEADSVELIDVREEEEFRAGHIKNSKLIPMSAVMERIGEIDFSKKVVLYCRTGSRSMHAATIIGSENDVYNLEGGIVEFARQGGEEFLEK